MEPNNPVEQSQAKPKRRFVGRKTISASETQSEPNAVIPTGICTKLP
jgi:hypothetical protein